MSLKKCDTVLTITDCDNGDLRLEGSSSSLEGRVEMCYDGVWGTVCNTLWSRADATVVCRQLGHSSSGLFQAQYTAV